MRLSLDFRTELGGVSTWITEELDHLIAKITGWWGVEHADDGSHKDIHATSVTSTGAISGTTGTFTGAGTFGGNVTALYGSTSAVIIGGSAAVGIGVTRGTEGWKDVSISTSANGHEWQWYDQKNFGSDYVARWVYDGTNYNFAPGSVVNTAKPVFLGEDAVGKRWSGLYSIIVKAVGRLTAGAEVIESGEIVPAALAANTDDYDPTDLATCLTVVVSATGAVNLTGLARGVVGRRLRIVNGGNFNITLTNEDGASAAANRFLGANSANVIVRPNGSKWLYYRSNSRWWIDGA